jgi:hypothetical protein
MNAEFSWFELIPKDEYHEGMMRCHEGGYGKDRAFYVLR